jgi:hypothetical protein
LWKALELEVRAGNSRLQLPCAHARLNRDFKMEILAYLDFGSGVGSGAAVVPKPWFRLSPWPISAA